VSQPDDHDPGADAVRCSEWTRAEGVDPIGTAGHHPAFLLVEHPLPWPKDVGDLPLVAALRDVADGARIQALVPPAGGDGARRIVLHRQRADAPGSGYERHEATVPPDDLVPAARRLLEQARSGPPDGDPVVDVLVCTHGRRDRCCGARGTALAKELDDAPPQLDDGSPVRIWRTSHLGGHRFAPTALVLPQGTMWAYVDADALARIASRTGDLTDLLPRYRGFAGIGPPSAQLLDRAAFAEVGWSWLDHHRWAEDPGDGGLLLHAESPTGARRSWRGTVRVRRSVPVAVCGRPISEAVKVDQELQLVDWAEITPG
jgi:hypothetical protein